MPRALAVACNRFRRADIKRTSIVLELGSIDPRSLASGRWCSAIPKKSTPTSDCRLDQVPNNLGMRQKMTVETCRDIAKRIQPQLKW